MTLDSKCWFCCKLCDGRVCDIYDLFSIVRWVHHCGRGGGARLRYSLYVVIVSQLDDLDSVVIA